jgi:hypothetical protein
VAVSTSKSLICSMSCSSAGGGRAQAWLNTSLPFLDRTWAIAAAAFDDDVIVNLMGLAGYCALVCMTVNAFQVVPRSLTCSPPAPSSPVGLHVSATVGGQTRGFDQPTCWLPRLFGLIAGEGDVGFVGVEGNVPGDLGDGSVGLLVGPDRVLW